MSEKVDRTGGSKNVTGDHASQNNAIDFIKTVNSSRVQAIETACDENDLELLASIACQSGGFTNDNLRKKAWPILLGIHSSPSIAVGSQWSTLPPHRDEAQVELDVNRSFVYYPDNMSETRLQERRNQLSNVILSTLRQFPDLCYFQGYHDIVQVLLLVLGEELSLATVPPLSLLRLRDFMLPVLSPSFQHLRLLPAIVTVVDPKLARHLAPAQPFFALSSTLTMFAHDIEDYQMIARLFDFLLAHETSLSMYLFAQIVLSRRKELFEIEPEDADMLHFTLSKLPKDLDLDHLISKAVQTFRDHPPETLPFKSWSGISRHSVLRTTRSGNVDGVVKFQTLQNGIESLRKQTHEVKREEFRKQLGLILWRYRRPVGVTSLAILVGLFSIWLQRHERGWSQIPLAKFQTLSRIWR